MHADLRHIDQTGDALAFLSQKLVAEPVAQEADGVADAFGLLGHAEIFRADHLVFGQKIDVPIGRGVGFQDFGSWVLSGAQVKLGLPAFLIRPRGGHRVAVHS